MEIVNKITVLYKYILVIFLNNLKLILIWFNKTDFAGFALFHTHVHISIVFIILLLIGCKNAIKI